jgi:hypothetical protein
MDVAVKSRVAITQTQTAMKKFTAAAVLSLVATVASAQSTAPRPLELGIDAGVTIGLGDNAITQIDIPVSAFRVGFPISPRTSLEPKIRLNIATGNDVTVTSYRAEVGLLYHLGSDRYPGAYQRAGVYARPFLGIVGASIDVDDGDDDSDSAGLLGIGLGWKHPLVSRLSSRLEANFAHQFGDGDFNEIGLLAGLSFFTR